VKYYIRRAIFWRSYAFRNSLEVWRFACGDAVLCGARVVGPGMGHKFSVASRHFYHVAEADLAALAFTTSPLFITKGAIGLGQLKNKFDVFCIRANPNPAVLATAFELGLGFVAEAGKPELTTPYHPATLNLVLPGKFTGGWRVYTCSCPRCTVGAAVPCSFYGAAQPPAWEGYEVSRSPAVATHTPDSFIGMFVDWMAVKWAGDLAFVEIIGNYIKTKLHRFKSVQKASDYVQKRIKSANWVTKWVLEKKASKQDILAKLALFQWEAPHREQTPEQFVDALLNQE
jgi:hypothetical protein